MALALAALGRGCSLCASAAARRSPLFELGINAGKSARAPALRLFFLQRTMSRIPSIASTSSYHWSNRKPMGCDIRPFSSQDSEVAEENTNDADHPRFSAEFPEGTVVELRKFPSFTDTSSVAEFFDGLDIVPNGILFLINPVTKKRLGSVLVAFASRQDANQALRYNNKIYRDRIVSISPCESSTFTELLDSIKEYKNEDCVAMRMTGLPYSSTKDDIVEFFDQVVTVPMDNITLLYLSDGSFSGDAIVRFDSDQDRKKAMGKNVTVVNGRAIHLIKITPEEYYLAYSRNISDLEEFKSYEKNAIKLLSLPFGCTLEELTNFLGEFKDKVEPDGVRMLYSAPKKFSGVAYVRMLSEEVAGEAARALNNTAMGVRSISVHQCFMMADLTRHSTSPTKSWLSSKRGTRPSSTILVRGFPYSTTTADLAQFFRDFSIKEDAVEMTYDHMGRPSGSAYVTFPSKEAANEAISSLNYKYIGTRYIELLRA